MSRYFMIQSWVGSHENEPDYNGQQCGERNVRSSEVVPLYDQYGNANIKAFSDEALEARKKKPKASVADKIDLAQRHYDRIEQLSIALDTEYFAGEIDDERYELLRFKMNERLAKAWARLEKDNAIIWQKQDEKLLTEEQAKAKLQIKEKSDCFLGKTADKSLIDGNGCVSLALRDCSNTNVFLIGICGIMKLIKKVKGEV